LVKVIAGALTKIGTTLKIIRRNTYTEYSISSRIAYISLNKNALRIGNQTRAFRSISIKGSKRGLT